MADKGAYAREMPGWDISGGDYNTTNVNYTDFKICEQACDSDSKCQAWTYVLRGPLYASCCLKSKVNKAKTKASCTSGVKNPVPGDLQGPQFFVDYVPPADGETVTKVAVGEVNGKTDTLKLLGSDEDINMRVFVDQTFSEVYWMGGRVAMTVTTQPSNVADVTVGADKAGVTLASATAWQVGSIWVTPEEVLATPRLDGTITV